MRSSERVVRVLLAFVVLYCVISSRDRDHETFPFFAWTLFVDVPEKKTVTYSIRITELDRRPNFKPTYFEDARGVIPGAGSVTPRILLRRWGSAVDRNRPKAKEFERQFETIYLRMFTHVRYEVVRRTFDPVERRRCECYSTEVVVGKGSLDRR